MAGHAMDSNRCPLTQVCVKNVTDKQNQWWRWRVTAEDLHEMRVDAIMMLEWKTLEDRIFEWDMESDECQKAFVEPAPEVYGMLICLSPDLLFKGKFMMMISRQRFRNF